MSLYSLKADTKSRKKKENLPELEEARRLSEGLLQRNFELKEQLGLREQLRQNLLTRNKNLKAELQLLLEFVSPDTPKDVVERVKKLLAE